MDYSSPLWVAWAAGTLQRGGGLIRGVALRPRLMSQDGEYVDRFQRIMGFGRARAGKNVFNGEAVVTWQPESLSESLEMVDKLLPFATKQLADHLVEIRERILESPAWKAEQEANS